MAERTEWQVIIEQRFLRKYGPHRLAYVVWRTVMHDDGWKPQEDGHTRALRIGSAL